MLQVYRRIKKNNKNIFFISVLVKAPRKVTKNNRETERRWEKDNDSTNISLFG